MGQIKFKNLSFFNIKCLNLRFMTIHELQKMQQFASFAAEVFKNFRAEQENKKSGAGN